MFDRARREGLSRDILFKDLGDFFTGPEARGQTLITAADKDAIHELIAGKLDDGVRCADWFGMDDLPGSPDKAAGAHGERFVGQFVAGMGDLLGNYLEMEVRTYAGKSYIGQDHFYYCVAHCQAAGAFTGGQLASKIVGAWHESRDARNNGAGSGKAMHAVLDSFVDSYVNRVGYKGANSATRCTDYCARLNPKTMP